MKKVPSLFIFLFLLPLLLLTACRPVSTPSPAPLPVATQPSLPTSPPPTNTPAPTSTPAPTLPPSTPTSSGSSDYGYSYDDYGSNTPATAKVRIQISQKEGLGRFLVDGQGRSLYLLISDQPDKSTCTGNCAVNWPPLLASGQVEAGEGIDATKLGTLTREDGSIQVTYNGHPLYYFAGDAQPGDTNGHQKGGRWFLVTPEGNPLK